MSGCRRGVPDSGLRLSTAHSRARGDALHGPPDPEVEPHAPTALRPPVSHVPAATPVSPSHGRATVHTGGLMRPTGLRGGRAGVTVSSHAAWHGFLSLTFANGRGAVGV